MLKKEFKKKDVKRARNLIRGNTGASSETQIGYKKIIKKYKEGDIWTENKKTWTIKNGIKQTISKLDKIRHHLDKSNYKLHKKCHKCVVEYEHKLKIEGKYNKYIKKLKTKNSITSLKEIESYLLDAVNASNNTYVSEDGVVERWVGGLDKQKLTKEIKNNSEERLKFLKKQLKDEKN